MGWLFGHSVNRSSYPEVSLRRGVPKIRTSACVFSCKFAAYFQNNFSQEYIWVADPEWSKYDNNLKVH